MEVSVTPAQKYPPGQKFLTGTRSVAVALILLRYHKVQVWTYLRNLEQSQCTSLPSSNSASLKSIAVFSNNTETLIIVYAFSLLLSPILNGTRFIQYPK